MAQPGRVLALVALIVVALLAIPTTVAASGANPSGTEYRPSVPAGGGPKPATDLAPAAADVAGAGPDSADSAGAGLTGAGETQIGSAFPVLLGVVMLAALASSIRRLRSER